MRGHLLAGLAAPASARLEAVAPVGQPLFIFVARDGDATLLLPREDRVIEHGSPAAVLEAVTGVPVDARELRHLLTACVDGADAPGGRSLGSEWRLVTFGSVDAYLRRDPKTQRWHVAAAVHRAATQWRAEYRDFENGLPRAVHLVSEDRSRFDLRLTLSQVALNESLAPEVFRVEVPASAERITLDELRNARQGVREN